MKIQIASYDILRFPISFLHAQVFPPLLLSHGGITSPEKAFLPVVHALLLLSQRYKHEPLVKPTRTAARSSLESTTYLLLSCTFPNTSFIIL